jgi:hypothetical protein
MLCDTAPHIDRRKLSSISTKNDPNCEREDGAYLGTENFALLDVETR